MQPTIRLSPEIKLSPNMEHGAFLTATVDLLWYSVLEDAEPHEEVLADHINALRDVPAEDNPLPRSIHRPRPDDPEHQCLASMTAQLAKENLAFSLEELLEQFANAAADYDALSSGADWLACTVGYAEGTRVDLIDEARYAADDGQIGWIGVIEEWGCSPMLDGPEIFAHMVDALGVLSGVCNGMFLVGAKSQDNSSAHTRIKAHVEAARWNMERRTEDGTLRVVPDAETEKDNMLLFVCVQNMSTPVEDYEVKVSLPETKEKSDEA